MFYGGRQGGRELSQCPALLDVLLDVCLCSERCHCQGLAQCSALAAQSGAFTQRENKFVLKAEISKGNYIEGHSSSRPEFL